MNLTLKNFWRITTVVLSLLLMPVGAWAQDFHWPEEPSARYADVSRFTVSEVDGQTVLTGHCLANTEMSFKLQTASGSAASATYSSSNTAVADRNTNSYTSSVEELVIKGAGTTTITATLSGDYTPNTYSYTLVITEIDTSYGINVYGTQVTSGNADNVLYDDYFNDGKITYDAENSELVLNNANIQDYQEPSIQFLGENLKVRLIGENRINNPFSHEGGGTGTVTFLSDGGEENCLIFSYCTDDASTVTENYFIDCTVANTLNGSSGWQLANKAFNSNNPNYKEAYLYKQESTAEPATLYNIWIGETQITSNNASNVTGPGISGSVSFEFDNSGYSPVYRLYLKDANLTVPIKTSVIFTIIYIEGDNSITSSSGPAIQGVQINGLAQANLNVRIKESGTQATLHVKTTDGVSSVAKGFGSFLEVGSETYLLTSGPVDYDTSADSFEETYKYRITGTPVDDMTFTTVSTSQIWVAGQQVLYDQQADILGDGTISYEYKTGYGSGVGRILTLNGFKMTDTYDGHAIIFGDDGNTNYVVVKYTGENVIRCTGYPFYTAHKSSWVNASFNPQSADDGNKITAYCDAPRISYNFNESTYNNYSGDGKHYGVYPIDGGHEVGPVTPYGFSIGGTEMHEGNLGYYEGLAYDADTHTITLDNTTLSGELKWDNEANLTILLKGSNTITGNIYTTKYDSDLTLTLVPTEGCSLTLDNSEDYYEYSVIKDFSSLTYDGLACSVSDAVYKDGNLVDADDGNILTATFTYQEANYGLTVAGIEVTSSNATDITGNEANDGTPQVVFDRATNTLTLTEAQITLTEAVPLVESSLTDLTIVLQGGRSDVWWNNIPNSPEAVFVLSNNDAKLTFRTTDGSSLYINDNITLFAGIETATYEGGLMLKQNDDWSAIAPLDQPYLYVNMSEDETGNPMYSLEINSDNGESTDYYYSVDYADESLEDVPTTKAEPNEDGYVSGIVLAGPCTVTAYAQVGDAKSAEKVGKLFGFETTQVKAVYGTESVALPTIIPALDEGMEVYYSPDDEAIATESDGVIVLGQKIGSTSLYANLQMPDIMPDYEVLNTEGMIGEISVTILPPVPSVDLAAGTYNEPQEMTVSSNLPNTVSYEMHYQRETAGVLASDSILYGSTLRVDATCKLYLYTRAMNDEGDSFYSDTLSLAYTIIPPTVLDISFADNTREWATYCASERDLDTPEGLEAYIVMEIGQSEVTVEKIDYIPQGVGVLLQRTASVTEPLKAKAFLGQETTIETNLLSGTTASTAVSSLSGDVYVLYNGEFVKTKKGSIAANRAYLTLNSAVAPARMGITFADNETTGVGEWTIDNGQLTNDNYYDLQGRRVAQPVKGGLYIKRSAEGRLQGKNGRKVIIK